ncbi:MAG: YetF domain-containing protein [Candidatus Limnocylindrales bacterium]
MPSIELPDLPSDLLGVALRTIVVYGFLVVALRLAGKREMGQLSVLDLVLILVIANSVQNAMVGDNVSVWGGIVAVIALILTDRALILLRSRSPTFERWFEGEPTMLVRDGKILDEAMRREGVDRHELEQALREHGYLDVSDIRLAVLEVDGTISVIGGNGEEGTTAPIGRRNRRKSAI